MYNGPGAAAGPHRAQCQRADQCRCRCWRSEDMALIEVRSVYDTDGLQRMGELHAHRRRPARGLRQGRSHSGQASRRAGHARPDVADLVRMKDPADPAYGCAPARFVRAVRAVAPPSSSMGVRDGNRRDRLRAAADPGLRADRARRLLQAARCRPTCRWALSRWWTAEGRSASRPTPTGSRCARASVASATAATARVAAPRSTPGRMADTDGLGDAEAPSSPVARQLRRDHGLHPHPPGPDRCCSLGTDMVFSDIWADATKARGATAQGRRSRCATPATPARHRRPEATAGAE